ncbi:hypothetical protein E2K93_06040 [Thalassotalea sp. HSM 43]|uniref:hypothetical protein n=1 Tax=Thalassotalea sp. HSM 43 TaxID=2552945 RepID=UPI001080FEF0|nr:hypothetical protein [Thalassotalea sp. HSM 43]QBY03972.1 hypothetical protein E2K93_06040 [Thalassotalea sp. HSM 43]
MLRSTLLFLLVLGCCHATANAKSIFQYTQFAHIDDVAMQKYMVGKSAARPSSTKHKKRGVHKRHSNWQRDLNQATWQTIQYETEWSKRAGLQVVNLRGKFFLMGGRSPVLEPRFPNESTLYNDVWVSHNQGASWHKVQDNSESSSWPARAYFKVVSKGNYMYLVGGQNFKPACAVPGIPADSPACPQVIPASDFFNDVWRSKDGKNWQLMTANAPWQGRAGLMVEVLNNRIYVFGGSANDDCAIIDPTSCQNPNQDPNGPPPREYFNDVWSSGNGVHWRLESSEAAWSKRAGGATLVKDRHIYLLGGEFGFLPDAQGNLPYLNDVWKSRNGKNWVRVTDAAQWSPRPGHQCGVLYGKMACFGGFGIPFNPPRVWVSSDGKDWNSLQTGAWNAAYSDFDPSAGTDIIKYDFDIVEYRNWRTGEQAIYSFGGDREVFFLPPGFPGTIEQFNFNRVDNDVWRFGFD